MTKLIAVVLGVLAIGGCRSGRGRGWVETTVWSVAPDRGAVVFLDDGGGLIERGPGGERRIELRECLPADNPSRDVLALGGSRALFFSFAVQGGNWVESGSVANETACVVDFGAGSVRATGTAMLGDPRLFAATVGPVTGWVYVLDQGDGVPLVDLAGGRETTLPVHRAERGRTAVAELADRIRVVHAELDNDPPYRGHLVIDDFDRASWPPAAVASRRIDLPARSDEIALSADGRWVAYDGRDYVDGGTASDFGLVDLTTGELVLAREHIDGNVHLHEVVVVDGAPYLLASFGAGGFDTREPASVRWLDRGGETVGGTIRHAAAALRWMPAWHRVLAADYGSLELLDLPPAHRGGR